MKKISLLILSCFLSVITLSQNLHTQNFNFLPSNVNPSELRPSDIPSINVLRQIGLSEDEIKEALSILNIVKVFIQIKVLILFLDLVLK